MFSKQSGARRGALEVRLTAMVFVYIEQEEGKEGAVGTLYQFKRNAGSGTSFPEANPGFLSQQPLWTCGKTE